MKNSGGLWYQRWMLLFVVVFAFVIVGAGYAIATNSAKQEKVTRDAVVCLMGSIAGRDGIPRPSQVETDEACARFLDAAGVEVEGPF